MQFIGFMIRVPEPHRDSPRRSHTPARGLVRIADVTLWMVAAACVISEAYFVAVPGGRGSSVISVFFWYVLPLSALLLAVWALRSSPDRRVSVTLLLGVTLGCAFGAEALLRAFPQRIAGLSIPIAVADSVCPGEWRRQAGCLAAAVRGIPFDRRTTLEVVQDFESEGVKAWPAIDASEYLKPAGTFRIENRAVVPLSPGIPGVLTVFCNESGDWITYVADEYGFNNPPGSHHDGAVDVAILGDSFVHGWCFPFEQTLVGRLRDLDSGVLGVGLEGSGPLMQLGLEVEYVAPLRPAIVVWVFFEGNDLRDLRKEASHELLIRYLEPGFRQGLRELGGRLDQVLREHLQALRLAEATDAGVTRTRRDAARERRRSVGGWLRLTETRSRLSRLLRSAEREQPYDSVLFARIARRLRDDVAGWGGRLVFAYLPSIRRFDDPSTANPHRTSILEEVNALGIPTVDLFDALSRHPDPLSLFPFRLESHFTEEGFELVAEAVNESLRTFRADTAEPTLSEGQTE